MRLIFAILFFFSASNAAFAQQWTIGLFCESVSPDKRLNNFFLIDSKKEQMRVASFNADKVSFVMPAIQLDKTPDELVNRKSGLTLNRKTLEMKWRNRKSACQLKTVEELNKLTEDHLNFLLKDNKL
jgi:hypothetical protein